MARALPAAVNRRGMQAGVGVRDAELEYRFETAWETPYEALKRLSAIYPRLRFCVETSGDVDHKEMFKLKNGVQA